MSGAFFCAALLTLYNGLRDTLPVLAAAALHEAGHLLACLCLRIPLRGMRLRPFGAVIGYDGAVSYPREAVVAAAGPAANLLGLFLCQLIPCGRFLFLFGFFCLGLALFNLLPVRPLDGGVLLCALLSLRFGCMTAERILRPLSALVSVLLWMCAAVVQLRCGGNLSLFAVSVYFLTSLSDP